MSGESLQNHFSDQIAELYCIAERVYFCANQIVAPAHSDISIPNISYPMQLEGNKFRLELTVGCLIPRSLYRDWKGEMLGIHQKEPNC